MTMFELVFSKINSGGAVMWILLVLSFVIWALLFRYSNLLEEDNEEGFYLKMKTLLSGVKKDKVQELSDVFAERISIDERVIVSLIAIAPLLGLLGTVGGMIETFASLETMEMFRPGGGIADGISQALLTTQLGLIVAVPALMILKWVQKKKKSVLDRINSDINLRMKQNEI